MSESAEFDASVAKILEEVSVYAPDAYRFVASAVTYTVNKLPAHRHVSAEELLAGAKEFAAAEFGAVAGSVLTDWGITEASDVGKIVYLLIGVGLLSASPEDSPDDFNISFGLSDEPAAEVRKTTGSLPLLDV